MLGTLNLIASGCNVAVYQWIRGLTPVEGQSGAEAFLRSSSSVGSFVSTADLLSSFSSLPFP
jgi:hypothetical protein